MKYGLIFVYLQHGISTINDKNFMQLIISLYIGDHFLVGQVTINFKVALIMYYILGFLLMHFHTAFAWLIKWSTDTQTQCLVVC